MTGRWHVLNGRNIPSLTILHKFFTSIQISHSSLLAHQCVHGSHDCLAYAFKAMAAHNNTIGSRSAAVCRPLAALLYSDCTFSYTQGAVAGCQLTMPSGNQRATSFCALSTASEPWMMFLRRISGVSLREHVSQLVWQPFLAAPLSSTSASIHSAERHEADGVRKRDRQRCMLLLDPSHASTVRTCRCRRTGRRGWCLAPSWPGWSRPASSCRS